MVLSLDENVLSSNKWSKQVMIYLPLDPRAMSDPAPTADHTMPLVVCRGLKNKREVIF